MNVCVCTCVCACVLVVRLCAWGLVANFAIFVPHHGLVLRLDGHCGAIEDEVLLEKREAGERSVTGRGPLIVLSFPSTKSRRGIFFKKKVYNCQFLSLFF